MHIKPQYQKKHLQMYKPLSGLLRICKLQKNKGSGIWYNSYLKWGIEKGLVNANVKPSDPLTRGAFARMVSLP